MPIKCKRIIGGKTYNTETATQISMHKHENDFMNEGYGEYLYQSRLGAFFWVSYTQGYGLGDTRELIPLTPEQAREWLEKYASYDVETIERLFGEMPEAGSSEVKYTLRMPESLRDRLSERAKDNNQSLNAWMIRCLESCSRDCGA